MEWNLAAARPGQRLAIQEIRKRVAEGLQHTSVILPTRYGKSDVIRLSAYQMFFDQVCCGSMVLSPGGDLRNQIVRSKKIKEMCKRYGLDFASAKNVHELRRTELNPFANRVYLLSSTIQYVNRNQDDMASLVESRTHNTGLPFVIFVDETHMVSSANQWGKSVAAFVGAGASVVLLTATADRADNNEIPGFAYEPIGEEESIRVVRTRSGDEVRVDIYKGQKIRHRIRANVEVTFAEAWNEDPSPLCTLSRDVIDVSVRQILDDIIADEHEMLSELSENAARDVLGKVVRDGRVIRRGVAMFVNELSRVQQLAPDAAGIVFTGADQDSDSQANKHAQEVQAAIQDISDLSCVIATTKCEDDTVSNHLSKFEAGKGDVLIVKNAGGAGFDCSRLKVMLDLSSVRTFSSTVQRIMRVATPHGKITNAVVITMADPAMSAIWERVIKESGGEWTEGDYELIDSHVVPAGKDGPGVKRAWRVEGAALGTYDDTLGKCGDMGLREQVEELLSMFPIIGTQYTKPAIAERLKNGKGSSVVGETIDEQVDAIQRSINKHMECLCRKRREGVAYSPSAYQETMKACYREMFTRASLTQARIELITDIELLRTLEAAAAALCSEGGVQWA